MCASESNPRRQQLLQKIQDPELKVFFQTLLESCEQTLVDRSELEQTILEVYRDTGRDVAQMVDAGLLLASMAERSLKGARQLESFLSSQAESASPEKPTSDADLAFDVDMGRQAEAKLVPAPIPELDDDYDPEIEEAMSVAAKVSRKYRNALRELAK